MDNTWLHGHEIDGDVVMVGPAICCAGCGKHNGTVSIVFDRHGNFRGDIPNWPFSEHECPVCLLRVERNSLIEEVRTFNSRRNRDRKLPG